jgi:hypothetical protein
MLRMASRINASKDGSDLVCGSSRLQIASFHVSNLGELSEVGQKVHEHAALDHRVSPIAGGCGHRNHASSGLRRE